MRASTLSQLSITVFIWLTTRLLDPVHGLSGFGWACLLGVGVGILFDWHNSNVRLEAGTE